MELSNKRLSSNLNNSFNEGLSINSVKVKGLGNSSLELSKDDIIIKSFQSNYTIKKSIDDIDFLVFSRGNFFFEDKMYMGISGEQFEITSKNDFELKNFYETLIRIKDNRQSKNTFLENKKNSNTRISENKSVETNKIDEIRNFHKLMEEGIISEEEFEAKKKELLK